MYLENSYCLIVWQSFIYYLISFEAMNIIQICMRLIIYNPVFVYSTYGFVSWITINLKRANSETYSDSQWANGILDETSNTELAKTF